MATIRDREATIKTAIVEIKALTVGGKQVTQSLFRQLEEKSIVDDETLQLVGVPWGRVNYHFDGCVDGGEHLHIVWQHQNELRRSCVMKRGGDFLASNLTAQADAWRKRAVLQIIRDQEPAYHGKPMTAAPHGGVYIFGPLEVEYEDVVLTSGSLKTKSVSAVRRYWQARKNLSNSRSDYEWQQVLNAVAEELGDTWWGWDIDHCIEQHNELAATAADIRRRWAIAYNDLCSLDQLFIAV